MSNIHRYIIRLMEMNHIGQWILKWWIDSEFRASSGDPEGISFRLTFINCEHMYPTHGSLLWMPAFAVFLAWWPQTRFGSFSLGPKRLLTDNTLRWMVLMSDVVMRFWNFVYSACCSRFLPCPRFLPKKYARSISIRQMSLFTLRKKGTPVNWKRPAFSTMIFMNFERFV